MLELEKDLAGAWEDLGNLAWAEMQAESERAMEGW